LWAFWKSSARLLCLIVPMDIDTMAAVMSSCVLSRVRAGLALLMVGAGIYHIAPAGFGRSPSVVAISAWRSS
jgi:hypothetical protein